MFIAFCAGAVNRGAGETVSLGEVWIVPAGPTETNCAPVQVMEYKPSVTPELRAVQITPSSEFSTVPDEPTVT